MKKGLSALLLLLLTISLIACSGGNKETPAASSEKATDISGAPTESTSTAAVTAEKNLEKLLSESYINIMKSGKFLMRYTATITTEAGSTTCEITTATDGENMSTVMNMMGLKIRTLMLDNVFYQVDDATKTYMKIEIPAIDTQNGLTETENLTYLGKGTGQVNGKTLPYEEYTADSTENGETMRFYMDGTNLYAISVKSAANEEMVMVILELTDKIPAGMLELPSDYSETTIPSIPSGIGMDEETQKELEDLQKQFEDIDLEELEKQAEELQKQFGVTP